MTPNDAMIWFAARGGIAHSATLRAAGCTDHLARTLVATGALTRVRRSWLVTPDCDERRVRAATLGGRVTCVSEAAMRGMWVPQSDGIVHVSVPHSRSRLDDTAARLHWGEGPSPVGTREVVEPIINVLHHVARCIPHDDALAVWESAARMKLVGAELLARTRWGTAAASVLAAEVSGQSDSGIETRFVMLMREIGVVVAQQVMIDGHRVDVLIGDRLIVQLDGFAHHSSSKDRGRDIKADARLALRGYTVLRFDYWQIMRDPHYVQDIIRAAMAQGLHLAM